MGYIFEGGMAQGALGIAMGVLFILAGGTLLRLEPLGRLLGFLAVGITAVSTGLSWGLWDTSIERTIIARRAAQGIPVRSGEVEFMQNLFPEGIAVALIVIAGLLFLCRARNS